MSALRGGCAGLSCRQQDVTIRYCFLDATFVAVRMAQNGVCTRAVGLILFGQWLVCGGVGKLIPGARASEDQPAPAASIARDLKLPTQFIERMMHRRVLDRYAARNYSIEADIRPGPVAPIIRSRPDARAVRIFRSEHPEAVMQYRERWAKPIRPFPAYRAPILENANEFRDAVIDHDGLSGKDREIADRIRAFLAHDGVLVTLARVMEILGPNEFRNEPQKSLRRLGDLGFPVDLLKYFRWPETVDESRKEIVESIAVELSKSKLSDVLVEKLRGVPFEFEKTSSQFAAAEEGGEYDLGLLRVQIGGGYDEGIVRGGSLDVAGQLIAALPDVDFIASAPSEFFENIRWLALNSWPLRRPNRLVLIEEKAPVSPWAQDNGKAGLLTGGGLDFGTPATLTPRYATRDEMDWLFCPGESFLMDGVQASGHSVFQSPLLFQGGNALVVRDPKKGERILLIAETEVYRNLTLGLTREQVLEAFRMEFSVQRCEVMPVVSYHLDYDVTFRVHDGQLIAFVNDALEAARLIVSRGIIALEKHGALAASAAELAKAELARGDATALQQRIWDSIRTLVNENGKFKADLVTAFASEATDQPVLNFQCFLASVDMLSACASESLSGESPGQPSGSQASGADDARAEYYAALRELQRAGQAQQEHIRLLGWKTVSVPSMPDLYHSVNYLNGLHDRTRYLIPVMGGFYSTVDNAAVAVFQGALGSSVKIVRVFTPDIQGQHGGVHCVVAAFPKVRQTHGTAYQLMPPESL